MMSKIRSDVYKEYVENKDSAHLSGFTFVVIGIVYVAGGKITEGNAKARLCIVLPFPWIIASLFTWLNDLAPDLLSFKCFKRSIDVRI